MSKSLSRIVGEGTIVTSASNIILRAVGLLTVFVVLKHLSVYEYGLTELVLSIIPLFSIFLLPGLHNVVIADMGIEKGKGNLGGVRQILTNFVLLRITLGVVVWTIVFFGADVIASFYEGKVGSMLKILSFTFLLAPFRMAIVVTFRVYLKFMWQSVYSLSEELVKLGIILFIIAAGRMGPEAIIVAYVLTDLVVLIMASPWFFSLARGLSKEKVAEPQPMWHLLRDHGKWGVFASYLSMFGKNIRLWIIKFFLGTEAVGLFAVAQGLIGHTVALFPLGNILAPIIPQYVEKKDMFLRIIHKGIKYQFVGFLIFGVVAATVFPPIITWLLPQYTSSLTLFSIMLLTLPMTGFTIVFSQIFYALKAQKSLFSAIVIKTGATILLLPVFIYFFGHIGIALEFVATTLLFAIERYRVIRRRLPDFKLSIRQMGTFDSIDRLLFNKAHTFVTTRATKMFRRL